MHSGQAPFNIPLANVKKLANYRKRYHNTPMNNKNKVLKELVIKIVDEGKATIELGTPESKALIELVYALYGA